jgi:hypothetical protein
VERHDGDVDDGMTSDGNGGGDVCCGGFLQNVVLLCVGFVVEYCMAVGIVWQLVSVFRVFPLSRVQDRR